MRTATLLVSTLCLGCIPANSSDAGTGSDATPAAVGQDAAFFCSTPSTDLAPVGFRGVFHAERTFDVDGTQTGTYVDARNLEFQPGGVAKERTFGCDFENGPFTSCWVADESGVTIPGDVPHVFRLELDGRLTMTYQGHPELGSLEFVPGAICVSRCAGLGPGGLAPCGTHDPWTTVDLGLPLDAGVPPDAGAQCPAYGSLATAVWSLGDSYGACTAPSDCVMEFWQGGCVDVCQQPINSQNRDAYRAAVAQAVYDYCACPGGSRPSVSCGPGQPLDCVNGSCKVAQPLADAGVDASCGEEAIKARFASCMATSDEPGCTSQGGSWVKASMAPDAGYACSCPTGQGSCPCASTDDCLAGCTNATSVAGPSDSCDGVVLTCDPTSRPVLGCHCRYWYAGTVEPVCVD